MENIANKMYKDLEVDFKTKEISKNFEMIMKTKNVLAGIEYLKMRAATIKEMQVIDMIINEINRQKAEIERLKTMHSEMCIGMKVLKKNAIKEIIKGLKKYNESIYSEFKAKIINEDIDNFVKEMVGDAEESSGTQKGESE